jgi:hypothetical protein
VRARIAPVLPWRTEPDLYRSDLAERLPAGLTLPRIFAVHEIDEASASIWLELVPTRAVTWDVEGHRHAAYLLGRLAASPAVAPLARAEHPGRNARLYAEHWLAHHVIPGLRSAHPWAHALVADTFDADLRARMLAATDTLPSLLDELDDMPTGTAHGDACTANLLTADHGLTLIDFGFWGKAPLGFDLGQLLLGDVQTGSRPATCLAELERACLPAYVDGLRAEGNCTPLADVRRAHAILMTIFHAIPAIPSEHYDAETTPELHRLFAGRAAIARFVLDLLDSSG